MEKGTPYNQQYPDKADLAKEAEREAELIDDLINDKDPGPITATEVDDRHAEAAQRLPRFTEPAAINGPLKGKDPEVIGRVAGTGEKIYRTPDPTSVEARALLDEMEEKALKATGVEVEERGMLDEYDPDKDVKVSLAAEAVRIVTGARRGAYGKPENNFARIAIMWNAYFQIMGYNTHLTAADISPMMRLMKEARLAESPQHRDSFVDLLGYTLTGAEIAGLEP